MLESGSPTNRSVQELEHRCRKLEGQLREWQALAARAVALLESSVHTIDMVADQVVPHPPPHPPFRPIEALREVRAQLADLKNAIVVLQREQ